MRLLLAVAVLLSSLSIHAASPSGSFTGKVSVEAVPLRSIAGWLRLYGVDGYVAADVADVAGIPRAEDEDLLQAKQRGFRTDQVLRMAQILSNEVPDSRRDYLLFMRQQPDGQVFFFLSTPHGGLMKAFVSIPGKSVVAPLERAEAESSFRLEVLYWEDKAATR